MPGASQTLSSGKAYLKQGRSSDVWSLLSARLSPSSIWKHGIDGQVGRNYKPESCDSIP